MQPDLATVCARTLFENCYLNPQLSTFFCILGNNGFFVARSDLLLLNALTVLQKVVKSLPNFLSAYLKIMLVQVILCYTMQ